MKKRAKYWSDLTTTDIVDGWTVRIRRKDGSTFVASNGTLANPQARAFFTRHPDARAHVKELAAHGMKGFVVRARVIFKAD